MIFDRIAVLDPCNPSPCKANGECRVKNDAAFCIYPECVVNEDCTRDAACYFHRCRDPCVGACGINSICQTVNHKPVCSCPRGYSGDALIRCKLSDVLIQPRPECTANSDCSNDETCWNKKCVNPCTLDTCGLNSRCHVQMHRAVCICNDGHTGNPQQSCRLIGCRSDNECLPREACLNEQCVDVCTMTQCGINALCEADGYHRARCLCPDGYTGNPYGDCVRPECTADESCASFLACRNNKCVDPCDCPSSAQCHVVNHRATCRCPPGYAGDPYDFCTKEPMEVFGCSIDADCPSTRACFSGSCKDPCIESEPCIANAKCTVVDTLPMRTMICECLPYHIGDATIACAPVDHQVQAFCQSDVECPLNMACLNLRCASPCAINPCSTSSECQVVNHRYSCACRSGLVGDAFVGCSNDTLPSPECMSNADCHLNLGCINQRCVDPCAHNHCGSNAECVTIDHHPTCHCPKSYAGDPQIQCFKPECKSDDDCPFDKACRNGNCASPCLVGTTVCGRGAECTVLAHRGQCTCPRGTQGDPFVACISAVCHYNEDCADHETCDRLNRVCRPVCDDETCATTATCFAQNHQPKCTCGPGMTGNPFIECVEMIEKPECREDNECSPSNACINARCQNPCALSNMCPAEQECRVLNTVPLRTMFCQCPPGTFNNEDGNCRKIVWQDVQCSLDEECQNHEKCSNGQCIEACFAVRCGINAQCSSSSHTGICTCPAEYTGNPYLQCSPEPSNPVPPPLPDCYSNDECPNDRQCINTKCANPCVSGDPCGRDSLCHVDRHNPVCKCPINYMGDPRIECIAPAVVLGCLSNSECAGTEACVNGKCTNPCNCGPNAKCLVTHHYPSCVCTPGYTGNPQLGCSKLECESDVECPYAETCHEGLCINVCFLKNECAINAECYGKNHRSSCRCGPGYFGNPEILCERAECTSDRECAQHLTCKNNRCVDLCSEHSTCAQNAQCYVRNHVALCRCPEDLSGGDPFSYCERSPPKDQPNCRKDVDCPTKLACMDENCVDPCQVIRPCQESARCSVLDTIPVRTMVCTCPEGWITNSDGVCRQISLDIVGTCTSDDECGEREACVNRRCRDPCNCGRSAICFVRDHKPICSCEQGYEGNPEKGCSTVQCHSDFECNLDKSCVNQICVNPCLLTKKRCGTNAECVPINHAPQCQCQAGFLGNPHDGCNVVGCYSHGDCPGNRACVNKQCIDPCIGENPCTSRAECRVREHLPNCRCPPGYVGNPQIDCRPEEEPECRVDADCTNTLACLNKKCQNPCIVIEPCQTPSECSVLPTYPVRTMICVCPTGYISSGSGTCETVKPFAKLECTSDNDCEPSKSCINALCKDPCNCGWNADCNVVNHKPICSCISGYDGNANTGCSRVPAGCRSNRECGETQICMQNSCIPACSPLLSPCAKEAECYGINHQAVCECPPGYAGNPRVSCNLLGCRRNTDCPTNKACINQRCNNPCEATNPCKGQLECTTYNHVIECSCPPGYIGNVEDDCTPILERCKQDYECPSQTACFDGDCINPCTKIEPCGINASCKVLDSKPVRTMICECLPGYRGNAVIRCNKTNRCAVEKGQIRDENGNCICLPGTAKDERGNCVPCRMETGMIITSDGRCMCALERGMIIDEYGKCVCPSEHGYQLDLQGYCKPTVVGCLHDEDCAEDRYCEEATRTCEDACRKQQICATNAICTAKGHRPTCACIGRFVGDGYTYCTEKTKDARTDFPIPDMGASCLSDGVQVQIQVQDQGFDGVLYVKGHSKDEMCRRVLSIPAETTHRTEIFKVAFGNCGLIHVNGQASFVLVIQKHPQLVTYKAQAYHVKCIYQTGEQNVTLGFNVSMLTTAGTIANTGPPPICIMRIITQTGSEINTAELGENLMLQVEVRPSSIYGGFARNCVAKTMEGSKENEYIVTDENGCAADSTIFGEWEQNSDSESLVASFNAFKFPSSDNIRFQCNIRVCFGRCQPVNCRGYNAFGRRRRDVDAEQNDTALSVSEGFDGQLREEITITSNLIRTLEIGEKRYPSDVAEAPAAQRAEDICVSMVGFIIALVITALLALVAVAIAVSCWLMAYRRQPKTAGPLPHPPEFPNPLFTTESVAEPSPDYLS